VSLYHAGLGAAARRRAMAEFLDGRTRIVAATVAFGMGVDKPDVRFVAHHAVSESVDAYWQEVGRAGRDGQPAEGILFYRPQDLGTRRFQASGRVDRAALDRVARGLRASGGSPVDPRDIAEDLDLSKTRVASALHRLEQVDLAVIADDGTVAAAPGVRQLDDDALDAAIDDAALAEEHRESFERSRVEMMRAYAEHEGCRRAFILGYFGEDYDPPCGNCDWCETHAGEPEAEPEDGLDVGVRVVHPVWGEGTVSGREPDQITVVFDSVGYRTLDVALVLERGLLGRA
jgi:ATP-dependent DNA helicase RecQ